MTEWALAAEVTVHVAAMVVYAIATGLAVFGMVMERAPLARAGHMTAVVALATHSVGLMLRWYGVAHGPYLTRYEVLSANAWAAMALFVFISWRNDRFRAVSLVVYPATLLLLGIGLYTGPEVQMLPPTFTGIWLVLHVSFYFVAFAAAVLSLGYGVLYLVRGTHFASRLPALPGASVLDRESYRFAGLTFAFWGIGMLTGAIWAYYSWGRFWGWDPVETWSLVTWFVYGIYLHARRFYGIKGRRAALLLVLGFVLAIISLFFTSFLTTSLHSEYFN